MRLFPTAAVLAAGTLMSACAMMGGGEAAPAAPAAAFDAARLSEHVRVLSDDSFQGRGIATPAEDMTIRYLSEQYAAAGFQPGGPNGAWTQDVALNRFTVSNVRAQLKVGDAAIPLAQGQQVGTLEVTTTTGTKVASVPLVVLQAVPEAGVFGRAWDAIRLWIK
jgi:D-alanyl-D-alanine carboxypeptidase